MACPSALLGWQGQRQLEMLGAGQSRLPELFSLLWMRYSILTEEILTNSIFIEILMSAQKVLVFVGQNFSTTKEESVLTC